MTTPKTMLQQQLRWARRWRAMASEYYNAGQDDDDCEWLELDPLDAIGYFSGLVAFLERLEKGE